MSFIVTNTSLSLNRTDDPFFYKPFMTSNFELITNEAAEKINRV